MKTVLSICTILCATQVLAAPQFSYNVGSVLSNADKSTLQEYVAHNCNNTILNSLTELKSKEYKYSAPEDLYNYLVVSTFEARYLFDGTHPVSTSIQIAFSEEKTETAGWASKVVGFKGLEDFCTNL